MRNSKIDARQEIGILSRKFGKQTGVTYDVMFAYTHEKINVLLPVLSIFVLFYNFNLKTQGFLYTLTLLSINWASVETSKFVVISAIQSFYIQPCPAFLPVSKNKSYSFPTLRLALIEYWSKHYKEGLNKNKTSDHYENMPIQIH